MKVVVSIPAFNEERTIGNVVREVKEAMKKSGYGHEILVVDDGSRDRTAELAKKAGADVYSHPRNLGLAEAFRTEIQKCLEKKADVIVHIDADGQYVPAEIPLLVKKINEGFDLVLGSRFRGRIERMPLIKRLGNRAFSRVVSQISNIKVTDAQTGFRAFTKDVARHLSMTSDHTYTQEQIIRAAKHKFRIAEVPVYFRRRNGKSRLISNPLEYALKAWLNIFRIYRDYEPLKFFGMLGLAFFGTGFLIGLYLVYLFLTTGIVGRIPTVVLSFLFLTIGVQVILFGFLADMLRK